jgi:chorismate lyase / 3-hydroxybenzoate synthase
VSSLFAPNVIPESSTTLPPLRIGYSPDAPATLLAQADVLAVIGFGVASVDDPRHLAIGLEIVGEPVVEVWRGSAPVRSGRDGRIRWSSDGHYGFFAIEVEEPHGDDIAAAADHAYVELLAAVRRSDTSHVLRLWNYFDAINDGEGDHERYRRFCMGRVRGMQGDWQDAYPAATAIGRRDGRRVLQVYALTSRAIGAPVENPRQVNAWRYPREYGPTAPTFARGMATAAGQLLISGTAAVVGFESHHEDDVVAQLDETLTNIASLIRSASIGAVSGPGAGSLLKVYVRDADDAALVSERLRAKLREIDGLLLLRGDICRRELLVEIDGVQI